MLTHTRVLTLNRSIPINGNISSVASRSPSERWASIRMQRMHHLRVCANTYTCTNLKQINPHQWEHIKRRQSIPIGEVGIYKNATHTWSESVLTQTHVLTLNRSISNTSSITSWSPSERWASIRMQRMHHLRVCANTYTCTNLKQINPHQWEHIKRRQSIPIGEVGIYKNATHTSFEGVC